VNPRLEGDWSAIDEGGTYTVLAGSFIASGKDGYVRMGEIADKIDLFKVDSETFISYAQEKGVLSDPSSDEYATQTFIAAGATGTESTITETEGDAKAETDVGAGAETTEANEGDAGTAEASTSKSASNDVVSPLLSLVVNLFAISAVVYV
jgi:hypothetical protein